MSKPQLPTIVTTFDDASSTSLPILAPPINTFHTPSQTSNQTHPFSPSTPPRDPSDTAHLSPTLAHLSTPSNRRHTRSPSEASDTGLLAPSSPTLTNRSSSIGGVTLDDPITPVEQKGILTNDGSGSGQTRHKRAGSEVTFGSSLGGGVGEEGSYSPLGSSRSNGQSNQHFGKKGNKTTSNDNQGTEMQDVSHHNSIMGKFRHLFRLHKSSHESDDSTVQDSSADPNNNNNNKSAGPAHIDPSLDNTDPTPFLHNPSLLASLVDPKSLDLLESMGGIEGVLHGLGVHPERGLGNMPTPEGAVIEAGSDAKKERDEERIARGAGGGGDDGKGLGAKGLEQQYKASMEDRQRVYGRNFIPQKKTKSLLQLMWMALTDKVLIILLIAAVVSLALGIYQAVGTPATIIYSPSCPNGCAEPKVDWVEGLAILIAVALVVVVGAVNDYNKELQFKKLNEKKEDRQINVIRGGSKMRINTKDLVVGDICTLEPGEILCCDGIYLRGHSVKCDESGATGESDLLKKSTYAECLEEKKGLKEGERLKRDCFLLSGAKVEDGVGEYVVISVGPNSFNGRIMMSLQGDNESTPLQLKLNSLAEFIVKAGTLAGILLFTALMIRYFVQLKSDPNRTPAVKGQAFVQILIISVTIVVVAVPEGLPLAVTLALAFATKRMVKENLLVRILASCETMANATLVCSDKTGTLTLNEMNVVAMTIGVDRHGEIKSANPSDNKDTDSSRDFNLMEMDSVFPQPIRDLVRDAIALNSTAYEDVNTETGKVSFVGSKTETALLGLGKDLGWTSSKDLRDKAEIAQVFPFQSEVKMMGVVVKTLTGGFRLHVKGASEIVLRLCTAHTETDTTDGDIKTSPLTQEERDVMNQTISAYANRCLRTICIGYKDLESWPPSGFTEESTLKDIAHAITLLATAAIQDPVRPGVPEAIADCNRAGVKVLMVTGDNVQTAKAIAVQCGIYHEGGIVIEGPAFRKLTDGQRLELVPRLNVMARSSPEDKRILVETAKSLGNIVAVTGDGSNDAPALKLANVGFAMGISGTEIAKEAADVIVLDDNFTSIVTALIWGRCVNDAVKRFLQFQISVNITAVVITFISAVASDEEDSVLTAVQLLWVNLIMDTFAALALATDPASRSSLDRKPERKGMPLLTPEMWKMIIAQALYQIVVCLVLHFVGLRILGLESNTDTNSELSTLVFNVFVFCQIFNQLNCRRLDRKLNILEGFWRNYYFMVIFAIMVGGQILIVEVGGAAFQVTRLGGRDWGITIFLGFLSIPLGAIVRLLPTAPFAKLMIRMNLYPDPDALPRSTTVWDEKYEYNSALTKTKNDLGLFAAVRGGRVRAATNVLRRRNSIKQIRKGQVTTSSLLAMVPTLVGGSIGAGPGFMAPAQTESAKMH